MIRVRLKSAILRYNRRYKVRLTLSALADMAGLSIATVQSISSRPVYNTRLSTIDRLCTVLDCSPAELLQHRATRLVPKRVKV